MFSSKMSSTKTKEKSVIKSKLGGEIARRIVIKFNQDIICVDDIFQMVVADESDYIQFFAFDVFKSMDFHIQQKMINVLSVVYDKMVLLNLDRIKCFDQILHFLTSHQYNFDVNGGRLKSQVVKTDSKIRLDVIKKSVNTIVETVSPKDLYQCDDKMLFLLKTISKNLFLLGSSKSKLLDTNFPVDSMEFCLNIFVMIHQKQPEYIKFKLALTKIDIIRMLERFQRSLCNNNERDNIILLESYYEVTALGTNMAHYRKRLELYWRHKTISTPSSISFPQLMSRLKNILTYKIMTMEAVLVVELRVKKNLEAFAKGNLEKEKDKLRKEISNANDNDKIKYKDMLVGYYVTSNCDNKNNKITRYIRSAESRVARTPFDQFVFTLFLILKSDFYSAPGMDDWRNETQMKIKDRQPQRRFDKSTDKKFNRLLKRKTIWMRNTLALNKITESITAALMVDVEKCGDIGFLAIRRALHVIGEFTKFTSSTRNISKELSDYMKTLHQCLSMGSPQKIRDMLSHNYSLYRIKRLNGLKSTDYKDMQSDLQNLQYIFNTMYHYHFHNISRQFYGTLFNCKSDMEAKSLIDYIHNILVLTCPGVQHSSEILTLLKNVQNNLIPILKTLSFDDLSLDEAHSVNIQNLSNVTSAAIEWSTLPPSKNEYTMFQKIMKFSNLTQLRKYISQCLHTVWLFPKQNHFYFGQPISIIHRLLLTISLSLNDKETYYKYTTMYQKIRCTMSVIEKKYALFLKIDQMKHFLDSGKNNIILELDILRSLDAIYLELGVSRIELQRHEENVCAFEELMKKLFTHTSIFEINEKYEALGKYFHSLGRSFHDQLQFLKKKEEQYIQRFLDDKISLVSRIPQTTEPFNQTGLQMLLLEILDILRVRNIKPNLYQLDEAAPVLCGNNMRNYLAHGSISYEVITCTEFGTANYHVFLNLSSIQYFKHQFELFVPHHDVIEMLFEKNDWNFDEQTKCIEAQAELEESIRSLNITKLRLATRRGAFFDGRDHRGRSIFEIFLNHHQPIYEQYENDKLSLKPEQSNFIQEFLGLLSPECMANAKYPEKPRNILGEAIEGITEGARDAIETDILPFACASNSVETVTLIIKNNLNFDLNRSKAEEMTPLAAACLYSRLDIITLLLEKIEIIELDNSLCHCLIFSNNIRTFEMIIPKCRDINVTLDEEMNTLLFLTVGLNCDFDIIKYLIDQDANTAHQNLYGDTITHLAVSQHREDLVKYLITKGIDCNVPNYILIELLYLACDNGNSNIIELLLDYQVNIVDLISALVAIIRSHRNDIFFMLFLKHRAQIDNAHMNGLIRCAGWLKNYKIVKFIMRDEKFKCIILQELLLTSVVSHDYSLFEMLLNCAEEQQQKLNQTKLNPLLFEAALCNHFKILERLIQIGADYTQKFRIPPQGCTILHVLVTSPLYDTRALRFLLTLNGSGLNAVDKSGLTPLYLAVASNNIVTAFILMKSGADVKIRSHVKNSVLHEACRQKNIEMIELLVRYGAIEQITWKNIDGHTPLDLAREGARDDTLIPYLEKLELSQHWILICKHRKIKFHPKLIRWLRKMRKQ